MKYLALHLHKGYVCPFCSSDKIGGESIEIIGNTAVQDCSCNACLKDWRDTYTLTDTIELV